jgi:hypothetical protein
MSTLGITSATILHALHLALALGLFWTCFCRQTRATADTRADVRFAFWLLSIAALVIAAAPYGADLWPAVFAPYTPAWPDVLLLAAIVTVQGITALHWRHGVPEAFQCDARSGQVPPRDLPPWPFPEQPADAATPQQRAATAADLVREFEEA